MLHFAGTTLVIVTVVLSVVCFSWKLFFLAPVFGYSFAWSGHFFFEKNRPATFRYPFRSLACDFVLYWCLLTRRMPFVDPPVSMKEILMSLEEERKSGRLVEPLRGKER
jgi:hypothetical protein